MLLPTELAARIFEACLTPTAAQPPFSMIERRSHDEDTFLNSINFVAASACCWNFSTQMGASTATTAIEIEQHVGLAVVDEGGELRPFLPQLVRDVAQHLAGLGPVGLQEG